MRCYCLDHQIIVTFSRVVNLVLSCSLHRVINLYNCIFVCDAMTKVIDMVIVGGIHKQNIRATTLIYLSC